jgi:hypothetical protein
MSVNLADPTGDLRFLAFDGTQDIWFEGIHSDADFVFTLTYTDGNGGTPFTDSFHMEIVDWQFVGTNGNQMIYANPIWKDALVAAAENGLEDPTGANGPDASSDFFQSELTGLSTDMSFALQVTSEDAPTDAYTYTSEQFVDDDGSLVQPDFNILYDGDMYLSTDDSPVTDTERSEIQTDLRASKNGHCHT